MGSLLLKMLVGGLAGLIAWLIIEPTNPGLGSQWQDFEVRLILALGALIGLGVGGLNGYIQGSRTHALRGFGLGLLLGSIGATLGYSVGGALAQAMFGGVRQGMGPITILSRVVALTPLGLFLGAAIGASSMNVKRAIQGAIGGAIGAALGAAMFDILGSAMSLFTLALQGVPAGKEGEVGSVPRAIFATTMGASIALFIGLVERFARSAWLRLSLGRNEGKEWPLDAGQSFIGRREGATVPLFGDANVAPTHAVIEKRGHEYVIADAGSPVGTFVNGQRISQAVLVPGSTIQIGGFVLTFLTKNSPAPVRGPEAYPGQAYPMGGGYPQPQPVQPQPPQAQYQTQGQMPHAQMPVGNPTVAFPAAAPSMPTQAFPAAQPTGVGIVALDGPMTGQRFPITQLIEVGREATGIRVSFDTGASRRHASVAPGYGGLAVQDLGSTNGTFINGQRIAQANAVIGDLIKIGSTTFRVESM